MKFINKEYIDQVKLELRAVGLKRQIEKNKQRAEEANKRTEQLKQKQEQYKQHLEKDKQEIDKLKKEKARLEKKLERRREVSEKGESYPDVTVNVNNKKTPSTDLFSSKTREQKPPNVENHSTIHKAI